MNSSNLLHNTNFQSSLKDVDPELLVTSLGYVQKYGPVLNTAQMADELGLSEDTMKQIISRGKIDMTFTKRGNNWFATAYEFAKFFCRKQSTENAHVNLSREDEAINKLKEMRKAAKNAAA